MRILSLLVLLGLSHCGYNWGHQTRDLPGGHKTVYVELFDNPTKELGLEADFAHALTQELERSGFAIVTNRDSAELIIKGDILSVDIVGKGSDPNFVSKDFSGNTIATRTATPYSASFFTAYSINIAVNLRAVRSRDKQLVWQSTFSGSEAFQSARLKRQGVRSSNVLYNEARKKQTIKLIAQQMMSDAFDRLTENF